MTGPATGARIQVGIVVASTRAAAGTYEDRSGPIIREWARTQGWDPGEVVVVPDGPAVGDGIREQLARGCALIVTSGGTGLSATDATPEETRAIIEREVPGIAEEIRRRGLAATPLSMLSRGLAGTAGRTLIVNLPGSPGGVRDGLAVLTDLAPHALAQLAGEDHTRGGVA